MLMRVLRGEALLIRVVHPPDATDSARPEPHRTVNEAAAERSRREWNGLGEEHKHSP